MSEYKDEDYFAIYLRCIRADLPVPFDCFILLKHANRIVLWVRKGATFPSSKFNKVKNKAIDKVYIRNVDKHLYYDYLDSFLKSEEGKESLNEIKNIGEKETIEGLPPEGEYTLQALRGSAEEEIEAPSLGSVSVENQDVQNDLGSVQVESPVKIDGPIGDAIEAIREEVKELEDVTVKGLLKEVEDQKVIEDCTLTLNEELVRVEGRLKSDDLIDHEQVDSIDKKFKEQIQIIKGTSGEEGFQLIHPSVEEVNGRIEELREILNAKKPNPRKLRKRIKLIKKQINSLSRMAKKEPHAIVSRTVNRILGNLETRLGERINLDSRVGTYDELPDHLSEQLNLDDMMDATSEDIKRFQHQIIKQSLVIQDLEKKYVKSRQSLKSLRDKWFLFHVQAKKNLTGGDVLAAKEIDKEFHELEDQYGGLQSDSNVLVNVAQELTNSMGGQHISIDPQLLAEIGALSEEDQEKLKNRIKEGDFEVRSEDKSEEKSPEDTSDSEETLSLGEMVARTDRAGSIIGGASSGISAETMEELEQLRSENEILKTQLENSQKLVESGSSKIEELSQLLERNNELTENLEAENEEYRRLITGLEEKVERFQSAETMYNDNMNDVGKEVKVAQSQVENQKEIIADLREQLDIKAKEVEGLKQNAKLDQAFKAQQERLDRMTKSLGLKQEEVLELKKEIINLTSKMNSFQQKYKHIASKMDRAKGEQEALKKTYRAAQTKAEGSTNALKQARKTINKLTTMSEQLRKDRQVYIRKTNENLSKYKAMMTQAANLNRQIEANAKLKADLENQLSKSQKSEKKLKAELQRLKMLHANLETKKAG